MYFKQAPFSRVNYKLNGVMIKIENYRPKNLSLYNDYIMLTQKSQSILVDFNV